ncbi:MAG: DUF4153 domain-containing protein [Bacteroidia bacterium]
MKKNDWILLASVAVYSYLFYAQDYGINFLLFTIFIITMLFVKDKNVVYSKSWIVAATGSIASALAVFVYGNYLSFLANVISLSILSALSFSYTTSVLFALLFSWYSYVSSIVFMVIDYLERKKKKLETSNPFSVKLILFLIPFIVVLIFFFLYKSSNPLFNNFTKNINLDWISWNWIRFTFVGFLILYGFFYHRVIGIFKNADEFASNDLNKEKSEYKSWFGISFTQHHENLSGIILFSLLNVLLLTVNLLDGFYLWGTGGLPVGMNYTDFVHQGTGTLITSIIFAILIILFYFRSALNFFEKNKIIRLLAYLWIAQNIFMIVSTAYRNNLYIEDYFLTYKRIGVYVYLLLSVIGLVTTFIKIKNIKSNWFLFRVNSWLFYAVLVISTFFRWDSIITKYNIKSAEEKRRPIDKNYLIDLSYINMPQLIMMSDSLQNKRMIDEEESGSGSGSFGSSFKFKRGFYDYYNEEKDFKPRMHLKLYNFLKEHDELQWQSYCVLKHEKYYEVMSLVKQNKITSLQLAQNGLPTMQPFAKITNLKSLDFNHNQWTNTEELKNFPLLETLDISYNPIDTIKVLPLLSHLKELNISSNHIYPIAKLSEWKTIEKLTAKEIGLNSLKAFPAFPELKNLDLSNNNIVDFSELNRYPKLEELTLDNSLSYYDFNFPKIPTLRILSLQGNQNKMQQSYLVDRLISFENLEELNLSGNQISIIPAASDTCDAIAKDKFCKSLTSLNLSTNRISYLNGISKFSNLETLEIAGNDLTALKGIESLLQLEVLILNHNDELADISNLKEAHALKSLDLGNCNQVRNFDALSSLSQLTSLDLSQTGFHDLDVLNNLNQLSFLDLSYNGITDVSVLKNKTSLRELILSGNKIENINTLYSLKQLKRLVVIGVTNIEELRKLKAALPHTEVISNMNDNELMNSMVDEVTTAVQAQN